MQSTTAPAAQVATSPAIVVANIGQPVFVAVADIHGAGHLLNVADIASAQARPQYFVGIVTLKTERAIELHREEFQVVRAALAAFTVNAGTSIPLPARRNFCDVRPDLRSDYLHAQGELYGAAARAGLRRDDREGRLRFASAFLGEAIHSWRTLTPAEMKLMRTAVEAGAVLHGWNYVPDLARN